MNTPYYPNLISELVPKDNVDDIETYSYFPSNDTVRTFMKDNGLDIIQIHWFKFNSDKKLQCNITVHDLSREEREGVVYLNRADSEEFNKIQYISNSSYLLKDQDIINSLHSDIQDSLNQYNNRSWWYKLKKQLLKWYGIYFITNNPTK